VQMWCAAPLAHETALRPITPAPHTTNHLLPASTPAVECQCLTGHFRYNHPLHLYNVMLTARSIPALPLLTPQEQVSGICMYTGAVGVSVY
jgi:hypothetical protein